MLNLIYIYINVFIVLTGIDSASKIKLLLTCLHDVRLVNICVVNEKRSFDRTRCDQKALGQHAFGPKLLVKKQRAHFLSLRNAF
jgi:hypothetical protein